MKPADDRDPQTYAILGIALEIHRQLEHGFLEAFYQEAAAIELPAKNIPREREVPLPIHYKNIVLPTRCGGMINFGTPNPQHKRLVWGYKNPKSV